MKSVKFEIKRELTAEEKAAFDVVKKLQAAGYESYIAGGAVRDLFLGNSSHDIDIATQATPEEIKKLFPESYGRGKQFGVMALKVGESEYEIATFRSDIGIFDHRHPTKIEFTNAEEDAKRRDFTINALFYEPKKEQIIDYVGGLDDLENKTLRFVGESEDRIDEDYLRMLRAARFASRLNYQIDAEGIKSIKKNASKIKKVSAERIRDELTKMLVNKSRVKAIELMESLGILKEIFPELLNLKKVSQPPEFHSEGDVWEHTLLALEKLPLHPSEEATWAVLLHDIAKPETQGFREHPKSKITFFEHDIKSAEQAEIILKRFKFSNEFIENIKWAIGQHMRIVNVFRGMSERKQKKLFTHPAAGLLLELTKADLGASLRPDGSPEMLMYHEASAKKEKFDKESSEEKTQVKKFDLVTGHDIIKILKISPGPKVGEVKNRIEQAYLDGKISTREEALGIIEEQK